MFQTPFTTAQAAFTYLEDRGKGEHKVWPLTNPAQPACLPGFFYIDP